MAITTNKTTIEGIDQEYPVAGQDNDSQGFRDNFSAIRSSLLQVETDLQDLENTTVKTDTDNDFNGNVIRDASLENVTEEVNVIAGVDSQIDINFTNGHYQSIQVVGNVTLRFALWPDANKVGKIRILIRADGNSRTVNWTTEAGGTIKYSKNISIIPATEMQDGLTYTILTQGTTDFTDFGATDNNVGTTFTYDSDAGSDPVTGSGLVQFNPWSPFTVKSAVDPVVVDFWTDDAGGVVYADYVGQFTT